MALRAVVGDDPIQSVEYLEDAARGIRFTYVGGAEMGHTSIFQLVIRGLRSMGVVAVGPSDLTPGDTDHALWTVRSVGAVIHRFDEPDIPAVAFVSEDDVTRSLLISAECLLAFGVFYNGSTLPADYMRVSINGQFYSWSDFNHSS